ANDGKDARQAVVGYLQCPADWTFGAEQRTSQRLTDNRDVRRARPIGCREIAARDARHSDRVEEARRHPVRLHLYRPATPLHDPRLVSTAQRAAFGERDGL